MLRVGINGYGTIGKRVADAVRAQPDMAVAGVAKRTPSHEAEIARDRGFPIYVPNDDSARAFADADIAVAGRVANLVEGSDVIVDATPSGVGETYVPLYRRLETPAIVQGGEAASTVDASFNARANFDDGRHADVARVVSCNTTGLARTLAPLAERFEIDQVRATLIRRGGDPAQSDRGPIDDILPDPLTVPSHHAADVETVLPDVAIDTIALRVPTTRMHVHALNVTFGERPEERAVRRCLADQSRIFVVPERYGTDGVGALTELGRDLGRPRGDLWETCLWEQSLSLSGRELYLFQAIDQQCNVVPENVDAIRSIARAADRETSMRRTDDILDIGLPERARIRSAERATT